MAGDEYYLQVRNEKKDILDDIYLGKCRYNNMYSIHNWKYNFSDNIFYKLYYEIEERKQDNEVRYSIFDNEIIEEIRNVCNNHSLTKLEEEAKDELCNTLKWIDKMLIKYNNIDIHFVLITILD
jgi:hypothetical protein